jgi:hypothetical protein
MQINKGEMTGVRPLIRNAVAFRILTPLPNELIKQALVPFAEFYFRLRAAFQAQRNLV